MCSASTANIAGRELELLYNYFVSQPKLSTKQCVLFYNCTEDQEDMDSLNLCKFVLLLVMVPTLVRYLVPTYLPT